MITVILHMTYSCIYIIAIFLSLKTTNNHKLRVTIRNIELKKNKILTNIKNNLRGNENINQINRKITTILISIKKKYI